MPIERSILAAPTRDLRVRRPPLLALAAGPQSAVAAAFLAFGVGFGFWYGGSAIILLRVGVGAAGYGVALTAYAGVYLIAMSSGGAFVRRLGLKRVLVGAILATGSGLGLLLIASDAVGFFAALVVSAFFGGLVDLTMNAAGARLERRLGRPILARLHGAASAGFAIGAASGGAIAASAVPWAASLLVASTMIGAAALIALAVPDEAATAPGTVPIGRAGLLSRTLIVLGLVIGVSIACESAALSWSALLLQHKAPQWAALFGLGAAFFAGCQALLRFNADGVRARVSDPKLIAASLGVAAAGFLIVAADAGFGFSVVGFAVIGFGTAAVVPCTFSLAASRPGVSAAAGLSTAAFFSAFVRLPAPLVTGAVADAFSLTSAFALFAGLLAAAVAAMLVFIPAEASAPARAPSP